MKSIRFLSLACLLGLSLWSCTKEVIKEVIVEVPAGEPTDAQGRIILEGNISSSRTLSASKKYILRDKVYVKAGFTLTIEPGTVIFGDKSTAGTLIIEPGAKIMAEGTAQKPIVFTSAQAKGSRAAGDWGGVVLMGKGAANRPAATLRPEGALAGTYGGANHGGVVDNDNSGVLKYVRIEFSGVALSTTANSEINGLTLYAVGKGTTLEYIQVSHCGDDSFEWFGGNVDAKYLISHRGVDDDFDTDFGYSGNVQFAVALRDPAVADQSTSNGFESDNYDPGTVTATDGTPKTTCNFANVSIFLDRTGAGFNALHGRGMHIRRNSSLSCYNSVFVGHTEGLRLDGAYTYQNGTNGTLKLQGIHLVDNPTSIAVAGTSAQVAPNPLAPAFTLQDVQTWFDATTSKNGRATTLANMLLNTNTFNLTTPNFLPQSSSPLLVTTNAVTLPAGLTQTDYIGAFKTTDWTAGWANFNPQNTDY
jgi:hypothetical protein